MRRSRAASQLSCRRLCQSGLSRITELTEGISLYVYMKGIYWNALQTAVQLIQQRLAVNGKFKNLVAAWSREAGVSAGLLYVLESRRSKLQYQ